LSPEASLLPNAACRTYPFLFSVGFVLVFGSLFAKSYESLSISIITMNWSNSSEINIFHWSLRFYWLLSYRIYLIFNSATLSKVVVTDKQLSIYLLVLVIMDCTFYCFLSFIEKCLMRSS
jgi:hypothetical protein